jgi:hypothetical protein
MLNDRASSASGANHKTSECFMTSGLRARRRAVSEELIIQRFLTEGDLSRD